MKETLQNYTEQEFLELLIESESIDFYDDLLEELIDFFNGKISHPRGSALLTQPSIVGIDDTSEAIIAEIKRCYAEQGLKCFKDC